MSLVRWRPFRDLMNVQCEFDRMFDEFFGRSLNVIDGGLWSPAVDVSEDNDNVYVAVEVPGMTKDSVKITLQDNLLTIQGEKKQETEQKGKNYHRMERSYGSFTRSFSLPTTIQADKIKASYKDGLLNITLPKAEEVKPKEIPIAIEGK